MKLMVLKISWNWFQEKSVKNNFFSFFRENAGPPFQQEDNRVAFFPEVPLDKVLGKKIEIMAIDIHFMKDGKFHQSWHIEDFASGVDQALNGASPPDFGFDEEFINF